MTKTKEQSRNPAICCDDSRSDHRSGHRSDDGTQPMHGHVPGGPHSRPEHHGEHEACRDDHPRNFSRQHACDGHEHGEHEDVKHEHGAHKHGGHGPIEHEHGKHGHGGQDRHGHGSHEHGRHGHGHIQKSSRAAASDQTVITVRAVSGLSGDMMLSGLAGLAGLSDADLSAFMEELHLPALLADGGCLRLEPRSVNHISGLGCAVSLPHEHAHRNLADIVKIIEDSDMPPQAKELSIHTFSLLAEAEAAVHGKAKEEVTFHEVGALDSILDICLVCRMFALINPGAFVCSPLPLADGLIRCAHGYIPSPAPAVLRMLQDIPVCGFAGQGETVTPTALALLKALRAEFGTWPEMTVQHTVISYGDKVFENAPNGAVWALGKRTKRG